jgi:hypothetical protein
VGPKQLRLFQAIPVEPKPTSSISKPLKSGETQLPPLQAVPVRPKPTSSIPNNYNLAKIWQKMFSSIPRHSMGPIRPKGASSKQAIPVWPTMFINLISSPCLVAAGHRTIQFLF